MMYSVRTKHLYGQAYSTQDRDDIIIFKIDGKMDGMTSTTTTWILNWFAVTVVIVLQF